MELKDIQSVAIALMDAAKKRELAEFSLKTDDFKIRIKTNAPTPVVVSTPAVLSENVSMDTPAAASSNKVPLLEVPSGTKVEAPLVGVFYGSPSPEDPPFIEVGQRVNKGDTLFIIEAMKTMNEITAPCDGTVSRILAQSGDVVEYKQVLVVIE